jgi:hypothetical protein
MIERDDNVKNEAGPHSRLSLRAAIPGDPFPWEPETRRSSDADESSTPSGSTPTPADSADPTSFDLGGGD